VADHAIWPGTTADCLEECESMGGSRTGERVDDLPAIRDRLTKLSSSGAADARGKQGALPGAIRRLHGAGTVAGPAITAHCGAGAVSAVLASFEQATAGQILVAQGTGEWAYFGELTGAEAVRIGLAAVVVDGYVRDLERLSTLELPIFARGLTSQGGRPTGPGEVGVPLRIGDAEVRTGDWIVADADGVVVIPQEDLDDVVSRAEAIAAGEAACWDTVLGGASLLDQPYQDGTILRQAIRSRADGSTAPDRSASHGSRDASTSPGAPVPEGTARIGPEELLAALALPAQGRVFDLGTELATGMPVGPIEAFGGFRITPYRTPKCIASPDNAPGFDFSMELIQGSPHIGTHFDAPAHIQSFGKVFGGHRAADVYDDFGWRENGIHTVPPVITRGVLLDIPALLEVPRLPDLFEVTVDHVQRALEREQVEVRRGDAVLVRTGKMADYHGDGSTYFDAGPGIGVDAALWLFERGMAVLGSDTSATEPYPFPDPDNTVHRAMLVERGIFLAEILCLDELAGANAYEFLFVCLPLKFHGGTGSWVRPVAVV
jgi:regulator of RNase E activity RraA/kynurenine formamidase